jgi:hypothetical protein
VVVLEALVMRHQAATVQHHYLTLPLVLAVVVVVHTITVQVKTVVQVVVVRVRTVQLLLEQAFQAKVLLVELELMQTLALVVAVVKLP